MSNRYFDQSMHQISQRIMFMQRQQIPAQIFQKKQSIQQSFDFSIVITNQKSQTNFFVLIITKHFENTNQIALITINQIFQQISQISSYQIF